MHTYYDAKDMLKKELDEIIETGKLDDRSLETVDKLLNSIKNSCKIIMYEEYADDGYSYADGDMDMADYSYARGRDSMGRYSSEGGYSNARDGRRMYSRRGGRYSYASDDKEDKIEMLREMMQESNSDEERRALQKIIRRMETD